MPGEELLAPFFVMLVCMLYLLLARFSDVLLGFEEGADVHGLASPDVSVDGPVEGKLQCSSVKRS
jgi:hypothetical protein